MGYQMDSDNWKSHSQLIDFREEAASVVVAGQVFFLRTALVHFKISRPGYSLEKKKTRKIFSLDLKKFINFLKLSIQMYIFGGLVDGELARTSEKLSGDEWTSGPDMPEGRSRYDQSHK